MRILAFLGLIISIFTCSGCAKLQDPVETYSYEEQLALEKLQSEQLQLQDELMFEVELEQDLILLTQGECLDGVE